MHELKIYLKYELIHTFWGKLYLSLKKIVALDKVKIFSKNQFHHSFEN